jgi:hypothetical protein
MTGFLDTRSMGTRSVCDECVRAVALIGLKTGTGLDTSFNAISRHPEIATDCALCNRGPGAHPAEEFVRLVVERRKGFGLAIREWRDQEDDH